MIMRQNHKVYGAKSVALNHLQILLTVCLLRYKCIISTIMDDLQRKLADVLVLLLGTVASIATLNALLAILMENIHRIRRSKLLSIIDNSSRRLGIIANRMNKRRGVVRRFWKRPGRTDALWGNFVKNIVVPEEWEENFRMSKRVRYRRIF